MMSMAHLPNRNEEDDRDGSYSDDFDGDVESDFVSPEAEAVSPGASFQKTHDQASSNFEISELSASGQSSTTFVRRPKNPKTQVKPLTSTALNKSRTSTSEVSRYSGSVNLQEKLTQLMKKLKHEQKENSRLREALSQLQRSDKNLDIDNEKTDLHRQLKEYRSEVKTLKTELRRYESAQAEYQQAVADYPKRVCSLNRDVRQAKEKYNELMAQHRESERQIRSQHDKICSLQKQLHNFSSNVKKGVNVKSEIEREKETWQIAEKEYRRTIADLKGMIQKEQRRNRRMSTSMKNTRDQFESEIIRLGNLLKEKERKLSIFTNKYSIVGQREGVLSRNDAHRLSMTSREGNPDLGTLSPSSDIAFELQTSLEQIKSAFPSESGCDPTDDDNQSHDQVHEVEEYEEDFDQ